MNCCDIMTRNPITCTPTTSVEEVARLMAASDIGSIPVVSTAGGDNLEGIVTDLRESLSGNDAIVFASRLSGNKVTTSRCVVH
ncbi:MAG TPA: CBS domain-containing protein [Candidatus Obscuribacterales bacterium]